jgi:hypothetical protein
MRPWHIQCLHGPSSGAFPLCPTLRLSWQLLFSKDLGPLGLYGGGSQFFHSPAFAGAPPAGTGVGTAVTVVLPQLVLLAPFV